MFGQTRFAVWFVFGIFGLIFWGCELEGNNHLDEESEVPGTAASHGPPAALASIGGDNRGAIEQGLLTETYRFFRAADGYVAHNQRNLFAARMSWEGVHLASHEDLADAAPWDLRLRLREFGRGPAKNIATPAEWVEGRCQVGGDARPRLTRDCLRRIETDHGGIVEWYENRSEGLEHGFDVHQKPSGEDEPLVISLDLLGADAVFVDDDEVEFQQSGEPVLRYTGLFAYDAHGSTLDTLIREESFGLSLIVDDANATYPIVVDPLMVTPSWFQESNSPYSDFGEVVVGIGDVNGDGFDDIAIAAPGFDRDDLDLGRVYVFHGSMAGLSTTADWVGDGTEASTYWGAATEGAGDVNNDGFDDLVIGCPYCSSETGVVYVYFGSSTGLSQSPDWEMSGQVNSEDFGYSLAGPADYNNDGYDDLAISAPWYSTEPDHYPGRVYIFNGGASGPSQSPDTILETDPGVQRFGYSLAAAGDVNGDGIGDLLVGTKLDGDVRAFYGSTTGLPQEASWTKTGTDYFGWVLDGAGDVNGDGFDDVIIATGRYDNNIGLGCGIYLFEGSSTGLRADHTWSDEVSLEAHHYSCSVSGAHDVDNDGFDDVIIGSDFGHAFLFYGDATGLSQNPGWTAVGETGAWFGYAVSAAGDINGDGFADVIVGSSAYSNSESTEGAVYAYHGSGLFPMGTPCTEDLQCEGGFCTDGVCSIAASCDFPLHIAELPFSAFTTTDDQYNSLETFDGSCANISTGGPQIVFQIQVTSVSPITIDVIPSSDLDVSLRLIAACDDLATCLDAIDDAPAGVIETLNYAPPAGESIFLVVEGAGNGDVAVNIRPRDEIDTEMDTGIHPIDIIDTDRIIGAEDTDSPPNTDAPECIEDPDEAPGNGWGCAIVPQRSATNLWTILCALLLN